MRGLIENIHFLIPLALIIAFRIMRAKNAGTKKQQKKTSEERRSELVRKIKEAQRIPEYRKASPQQARGAQKPQTGARQAARPVKPSPRTPPKRSEYKPLFPETAEVKTQEQLPSKTKSDVTAAAQVTPVVSPSSQTGFSLQGLTPLQQAVVWSEILGQPKGVSI